MTQYQITLTTNEESMERVRKAVFGSSKTNYFGVPLHEITRRENSDVPRLVKDTCEYLFENALQTEGLFRMNGSIKETERLKRQYESQNWADLRTAKDAHSVASLLKLWLRELPDGLLNYEQTKLFIQIYKTKTDCQDYISRSKVALNTLPNNNLLTMRCIINLLSATANNEETNKMTKKSLGIVLGPSLFRVSSDVAGLRDQSITNSVVEKFIEHAHQLFPPSTSDKGKSSAPARPPPPNFQENSSPIPSPRKSKNVKMTKTEDIVKFGSLSDDESIHSLSPLCLESDRSEISPSPVIFNNTKISEPVERIIGQIVADELFGHGQSEAKSPIAAPRRKQRNHPEVIESTQESTGLDSLPDTPLLDCYKRAPGPKNRRLPSRHNSNTDYFVSKPKIAFDVKSDTNDNEYYVPPLDLSNLHENDEVEPISRVPVKPEAVIISPRSNVVQLRNLDTEIPPSPPLEPHSVYATKAEEEQLNNIKSLTKKLNSAKRKMKQFEKSFEEDHNYRPSEQDKRTFPEISNLLEEIAVLKKELKSESSSLAITTSAKKNDTIFNFTLTEDCRVQTAPVYKEAKEERQTKSENHCTMEEMVNSLQKKLAWRRNAAGRTSDLNSMTFQEIGEEKVLVQKALLQLENKFGRPTSKSEKDVVRPLYHHYRSVKRALQNYQILESLPEHGELDHSSTINLNRTSSLDYEDMNVTQLIPTTNDSQLHELSLTELATERNKLLAVKKELRKLMKKQFPPPDAQIRYKQTKHRLKLIDALLAKHTPESGDDGYIRPTNCSYSKKK